MWWKFVSNLREVGGFLCTPVSYANKTESHLTEMLLKVALSILNQTKLSQINKKNSQQLLDLQPSVAFYLDEERP